MHALAESISHYSTQSGSVEMSDSPLLVTESLRTNDSGPLVFMSRLRRKALRVPPYLAPSSQHSSRLMSCVPCLRPRFNCISRTRYQIQDARLVLCSASSPVHCPNESSVYRWLSWLDLRLVDLERMEHKRRGCCGNEKGYQRHGYKISLIPSEDNVFVPNLFPTPP